MKTKRQRRHKMKNIQRKQQLRSSSFTALNFKKVRSSEKMAAFPNLNTDSGLKKLDEHLLTRYFITSHKASKDDITLYAALSKPPPSQYVNASRWYNHIETLLSISGISSERIGVTIDGLTTITEEAAANSKDGVVVIDDDDNDHDVDLEEKKAADEDRAASLTANTEKEVSWGSIVMVIVPQYGEIDMKKLEEDIRCIQMEGVIWGASKLVPLGYGVESLRIVASCPEDEEFDRFDELVSDHVMALGRFSVGTAGLKESLILIKPMDDEADMQKLEEAVRSIHVTGLFWGASKLVPVGYGIKLLGITCTAVGYLWHLRRMVHLDTVVKEQIVDNQYAQSCQILRINRICNGITEEESDSKDDAADDDVDLYREERAGSLHTLRLRLTTKMKLLRSLCIGDGLRPKQIKGVLWGASKIIEVGYGFKCLRTVFTIVDDLVSLDTVIQKTGGMLLNREYRMEKKVQGEALK